MVNDALVFNIITWMAMSGSPIHPVKAVKYVIKPFAICHQAIKHQNHIYKKILGADLALLIAIPILYADGVKNEIKQRF